ncbi:hypothetical protein TNCV_5002221 [Trichonephila clavipes]|nr:hypothetical protein TNCV_5002221 [Trichonephila clavipes]
MVLLSEPYKQSLPYPDCTIWQTKLGNSMVPKLSPLDSIDSNGVGWGYEQEWSDSVFQVPDSCSFASRRCIGQKRLIVAMYFTRVSSFNTWTIVTPAQCAEHHLKTPNL